MCHDLLRFVSGEGGGHDLVYLDGRFTDVGITGRFVDMWQDHVFISGWPQCAPNTMYIVMDRIPGYTL